MEKIVWHARPWLKSFIESRTGRASRTGTRKIFFEGGNVAGVGEEGTTTERVWFQNRRAKWRRQEKMDAAKLGLSEYRHAASMRNVAIPALGLPGDPWLHPTGLLNALPGFLPGPHAGYASYLTSPRRLPSPPTVAAVGNSLSGALSGGMASIASGGHGVQPPASPPGVQDPRTSSIQALRMRAKEHVESLSKGLQQVVRASSTQPGRDETFVSVS
ncbi:PREDICTED: retinal homeobox protein Rx2-like [Ceratosolen solmsi marchali]|uniref:Retinal homeobox protein Rx2-like n=1 Tax=Ceratosolen solmsi marchali TaxID=326594 RepID=A0AAJ6YLV9_9HYME|nr:PREDICTED: retinal homeobox protein Rx2-like [Ceratosolen solmsi marchali]